MSFRYGSSDQDQDLYKSIRELERENDEIDSRMSSRERQTITRQKWSDTEIWEMDTLLPKIEEE